MRRVARTAGVMLALLSPGTALAQDGPEIGGTVEGVLRLEIEESASLGAFPAAAGTAETTLTTKIVATDGPVTLSVADGDRTEGSQLGRLVAGGSPLASPLEAAAGSGAFAALGGEPVLREWSREIGLTTTVVRLRQRLSARELRRGPAPKTVLVTASVGAP